MPIRCEIVSQDRVVYEGDVDMVIAPCTLGQVGILPNHAPMLSTLELGSLRVRRGEEEEVFSVTGGVIEVLPHQVTVLADAAENVAEINIERAREARRRAEKILEEGPPPDSDVYLKMEAALRRSNLRLKLADRYRRRGQRARPPGMGS
ncbi:MAG: ATP synthase epsilon chain [Chloroflexi bacterium]|nr:ATP synthase epsilon chain [Chloroflexota bacterium]